VTTRGWRLARLEGPDGPRPGAVDPAEPGRIAVLRAVEPLSLLEPGALPAHAAEANEILEGVDPETLSPPDPWRLVLPVEPPEVWCAGVTYERSRDARLEESRTEARDAYSLVYDAERPELFLKDAAGRRTVGPGGPIGIRSDSAWNVPEPELGLVLGEAGALLGVTAGNDVSSRDIEGENPLYLPQAKVYAGACAIGPAVLVPYDWDEPFPIELRIRGADGATLFEGETSTGRMRRSFAELAAFCVLDNPVPPGSVLLTGTGLVPPDEFTLEPGHVVEVAIPGIGRLVNEVATAGELL
jgi:2-dehydro-3-deoxy-D-arabinonate dehydratase